PGKKLLFMGGEFGQFDEWKDFDGLDWQVLQYPMHAGMNDYVKDLNATYLSDEALWEQDHSSYGFEWIDVNNAEQCMLSFQRMGRHSPNPTVAVCNFSRQSHSDYRIGVSVPGRYRLQLNSDERRYGGSGQLVPLVALAEPVPMHGKPYSIVVPVPSLSLQMWKSETDKNSLIIL
ncbi:MAG: alpha amylase C-terminal domain-containing protein, partial [Cohnella sp.]|nr:alpha amylase C-terminal domain-containing protein [Cohnella sp.]